MKTRTTATLASAVLTGLLLISNTGLAQGVTVSSGGPYTAVVNEPIIFRAAVTGAVTEPAFAWDLDNNGSYEKPGQYPMSSFGAVGTYTITVQATVDTVPYTDTTTVTITQGPKAICVPWQIAGTTEIPHTAIAAQATLLKAVVYGKSNGAGAPLQYKWTFGDGTRYPTDGSWANASTASGYTVVYNLEISHTYGALPGGVESKPYTATLTVKDCDGNQAADNYYLRVYAATTLDLDVNTAVDKALWCLHKAQYRTTDANNGAWLYNYTGHTGQYHYAGATASALQAFQTNGHGLLGDVSANPYVCDVRMGFENMLSRLNTVTMTVQTYGNPDTNGNTVGIQVNSNRSIYEGGQVMDAICASQMPNFRLYVPGANAYVTAPNSYIAGRKFHDIVQDMVDMYAWGQEESGGGRGGWQYSWNTGSDNSAAQWGAIGMLAAQDIFGIAIPQWVKDNNLIWLNYSYRSYRADGDTGFPYAAEGGSRQFGYTGSGTGLATNASGMVQLVFDDLTTSDTKWQTTENYYADNWNTLYSSSNYYAGYAFVKAMRLAKPNPITLLTKNGFDWYGNNTSGIARWLIGKQAADGSWVAAGSDPGYGYVSTHLATAWSVIMLGQSLFELVPVAEAGPNLVWGKNQARMLDASYSYHLDPERTLVKYEWIQDAPVGYESESFHYTATRRVAGRAVVYDWDLNGDSVTDITTDTPAIEHTWVLPYKPAADYLPYTVTLKVTDDNTPTPQTDTDTFTALILDVKPPQSDPGGPYTVYEGVPARLDGTGSTEWDPGDYITQYDWLLSGGSTIDKTGDASTASVFDWRFFNTGSLTIGLTVYDNGVGLPEGERLSNTEYTTVEVIPNTLPVAEAGGPYNMVEGTTIQLTAQGSSDADGHTLTYAWDLDNDGQFDDATGQVVNFSANDNGSYTVRVEVWDGAKNEGGTRLVSTDTALVTVTDKHPTVGFYATPAAPFEGQQVQFTDTSTSSPDALLSWDWDFDVAGGATTDSTTRHPTHTYTANGTYTIRSTVKDDDDVTGTVMEQQITVRDTEPVPNFTFTPATPVLVTRLRTGVDVTFNDASTTGMDAIVRRDWSFSDGGTASGASVVHNYTAIGTYYATLTVQDADGLPHSITRQVTVSAPADLVITSVNATPLPLAQGGQVEFSATVRNQGTGDVVVPFLVDFRIYGTSLGTVEVVSLASGASRTVTRYWTAVPGGDPDVTVTADSTNVVTEDNIQGTAETNNTAVLDLAAFALPDLEVENPGVTPDNPVQGDIVHLYATLKNTGLGDTKSPIKLDFYVDGAKVGNTVYSLGLAAGRRASVQVQLPWTALAGAQKALRVVVDPDNTVPEEADGGETNNEATGTVAGIAYPDLTVTDISWTPPTLKQGQAATFYVTIQNLGATTKYDIPVRVKVGSTVVGTPTLYRGLAAGATGQVSTIWVATYGVSLQVEATVDPGNPGAVPETQDNDGTGNDNNVRSEALGDIALPDLTVPNVSTVPSTGLAQGMTIDLVATVQNIGQATAPAETAVEFKVDGTVVGTKTVGRVLQASNDQVVLVVPWTVTAGTHTFQAVVDPTDAVTEASDANNTSTVLNLPEVLRPDLTVSDLTWDVATPTQGQTVTFTAKVWNTGARTTLPVLVTFDVDGQTVGSRTFPTGLVQMNPNNPGEAQTVTATWTAQSGASHVVGIHVDHPVSLIPESNENNNYLSRNYGIVAAPDLVVDSITADPATPDQGQSVTLTATIRNAGAGATLQNIPVRLRVDGTTLADRTITGGLTAGASKTATATWTARSGGHTVQVTADHTAVIAESNEANNSLNQAVAVSYPRLDVDGGTVSWSASSRGEGAAIALTLEVVNNGQGATLNGFNVTLYEDGAAKYTARVGNTLAAGARATVNLIWIAKRNVTALTVLDDSGNEVVESDEIRGDGGRGTAFTIPTIPTVTAAPTIAFDGAFPPSSTPATPYSGTQTVGWTAAVGDGGLTLDLVSLYAVRNGGRFLIYSEAYAGASTTDSYVWDTGKLAGGAPFADGTAQLLVRATDSNGGWVETTSIPFAIDNTPTARLTSDASRRSALLDETRTYVFTLANGQSAIATYDLAVTKPAGVTAQLDKAQLVDVPAWGQATFILTASSPDAGSFGITVTATEWLQTRNDPLVASAAVYLDVKEPIEMALTPTGSQTVAMGGTVQCQLTLVNNQRVTDTFSLSAAGIPQAWVSGLTPTVQLGAGARTTVPFRLVGLDAQGTFTVSVTALSANRGQLYTRSFAVQTDPDPSIADLRPANNTRFGARDVTISWTTVVDATTEVYYRSEAWTGRDETYTLATGLRGTRHIVQLADLERNRKYFFYVHSVSDFGEARFPASGEWAFIVDNGVVFTRDTYPVTVTRDYGGEANISIVNTDSVPHEVYLTVSNIAEELAVGFVGAGHDTELVVAPGASTTVKLGIFTQDASVSDYVFDLHLETDPRLPDPILDDATLNLHVNFPSTDFSMQVIGTDPATLGKQVRLTNNGDPVTDFRVVPDNDLFGEVRLEPDVTHGYLRTGQSLTFWVYPELYTGFQYLGGNITAFGAGDSADLFLEFETPEGQTLYVAPVTQHLPAPTTTFTSDLQVKVLEMTDTRRVVKFYLPDTENTDYVIYTFEDTPTTDPAPGNPQAVYVGGAGNWSCFSYTPSGAEVGILFQATLPVETNSRGRATNFVNRAVTVVSHGVDTAQTVNDYYNTANGWVEKYNDSQSWGDYVNNNSGIPDDMRTPVKLFHDFLNVGSDLVGEVPVVGSLLGPMFEAALETFKTGIEVVSNHNRQLNEVLDMLEGRTSGRDWYCTNRPRVSSNCQLPSWVDPRYVSDARGGLQVNPDRYGQTQPHDFNLLVNGNPVLSMSQSVPSGYLTFPVAPGILNYGTGQGPSVNTITAVGSNFNPGHYASAYDFFIAVTLTDAVVPIFATEETIGNVIWSWIQAHRRRPDFSVYESDISYGPVASPRAGVESKLQVRVNNEGGVSEVALVTVTVDSVVLTRFWTFISAYDRNEFAIDWTPSGGDQTVACSVWTRAHESRTDNNSASTTISTPNSTTDTTGPVVSSLFPADGATLDNAYTRVGAAYSDRSGINTGLVTLTIDGTNVTSSATVTAGQILYEPGLAFSGGSHTAVLVVRDQAGNETARSWSFTVNTSLPVLTNVEAINVTATGAIIVWETNSPSDSLVRYGTNPDLQDQVKFDSAYVTAHEIRLGGLTSATRYYAEAFSTRAGGYMGRSGVFSFFTGSNNLPETPSAPEPADAATGVGVSPLLSWTCSDADESDALLYDVYFGTDPDLTVAGSNRAEAGTRIIPRLNLPQWQAEGLQYDTQYYWRIVATDSRGGRTIGSVWGFRTAANTGGLPEITNVVVDPPVVTRPAVGSGLTVNVTITFTATTSLLDLRARWGAVNLGVPSRSGRDERGRETYTLTYVVTESSDVGTEAIVVGGRDDQNNEAADSRALLTIEPPAEAAPSAMFSVAPTDPRSLTFVFTDQSTGATSWAWEFDYVERNRTVDSTEEHPVHTYAGTGEYTVRLTATNNTGIATSQSTIDLLGPEVSIDSPSVTNVSEPSLWGDAKPTGTFETDPVWVSVTIDGTTYDQETTPAVVFDTELWTWSLDLTGYSLADGTYDVTVEAGDSLDNIGSAFDTLTVDTVNPDVAYESPTGWTSSNTPDLAGTVSDATSGIDSVYISVWADRDTSASGYAELGDGTWTFDVGNALDGYTLDDGTYTVRATAQDQAGNTSTAYGTLSVDATAPEVNVSSATATTIAQPAFAGSASDATSGVAEVLVTLMDAQGTALLDNVAAILTRGAWALSYSGDDLSYGYYTVTATAADQAGNSATPQTQRLQVTPDYELVVIGDDAPGSENQATALNDNEEIIGTFTNGSSSRGAFKWVDGSTVTLDLPVEASGYVTAQDIDNSGWVVGYWVQPGYTNGVQWDVEDTSASTLVASTSLGGRTAQLFGIRGGASPSGVGAVADSTGVMRAITAPSGRATPVALAALSSGGSAYAYGANVNGVVVGKARDANGAWRAVKWIGSQPPVLLDTLNSRDSQAKAVNASGVIVGYRTDAGTVTRPWVDTGSGMTDLPTLSGRGAAALAINDGGLIVGWAETADGKPHAVLWQDGNIADLNDLIPSPTEASGATIVLTRAVDVNADMAIVGQGEFDREGVEKRAYLLRPVDTNLPGENLVPAARITQPGTNAKLGLGEAVVVTASALDLDGTVEEVTISADTARGGREQLGTWPGRARGTRGEYSTTWTPAAEGSYSLVVEAVDDEGKTVTRQIDVTVVAGAETTFVLNLNQGWNFISVPLQPADPAALLAAFGTTWECTTAGFDLATTVRPKVAYWVWTGVAKSINFTGYYIADTGKSVIEGWNSVGSVNNLTAPYGIAFRISGRPVGPSLEMYGWSTADAEYQPVSEGQATAGQGYWLRSNQSGTLDVGPPLGPSEEP